MIKSLYMTSYSGTSGKSLAYSKVLDNCRDFLRKRQEEVSELTGKEFNNKVSSIIYDFIYNAKPIVPEMTKDNGEVNIDRLAEKLYEDMIMCGPITEAMEDSTNTDIYCFGTGVGSLLKKRGKQWIPIKDINGNELYFNTVEEIESVINKLASASEQRLSTSNPILYATTIQKFRLSASDKSISTMYHMPNGDRVQLPMFSLRMGADKELSLDDMVYKLKTIHPEVAKYLKLYAKLPGIKIVFSGVPGTGKTTIMTELLKTLRGKFIYTTERNAEIDLRQYDSTGKPTNMVKSLIATSDDQTSNSDTSISTPYNLFMYSLREKVDIYVLGEIRTAFETKVMTEAGPSGQGIFATYHGEDGNSTLSRLKKQVKQLNNMTSEDAAEEIYNSINIIVSMGANAIDGKIRPTEISQVTMEGTKVVAKPLMIFKKKSRQINPETGQIYGNYQIVSTPSDRLEKYINDSDITDEDEEFLMREASMENPIELSEVW